jgi:hypothetical protein
MTVSSARAAGLGSAAVVVEYDPRFDYRLGPPNGSTATMTAGLVPRCLKREFEPRAERGIPPAWLRPRARCRQCGHDFPIASSDPNLKRFVTSGSWCGIHQGPVIYTRSLFWPHSTPDPIDIKKGSLIRYPRWGYVMSLLPSFLPSKRASCGLRVSPRASVNRCGRTALATRLEQPGVALNS